VSGVRFLVQIVSLLFVAHRAAVHRTGPRDKLGLNNNDDDDDPTAGNRTYNNICPVSVSLYKYYLFCSWRTEQQFSNGPHATNVHATNSALMTMMMMTSLALGIECIIIRVRCPFPCTNSITSVRGAPSSSSSNGSTRQAPPQ